MEMGTAEAGRLLAGSPWADNASIQQHAPCAKLGHSNMGSSARAHTKRPIRLPEFNLLQNILRNLAALIVYILRELPDDGKVDVITNSRYLDART